MGITYGDHLIDSGHYEMTPEQEREIVEDRMCDSVADDLRQCANEPWKYDGGSWPDKMIAGAAEIDRLRSELADKDARVAELEAKTIEWMKVCTRKGEEHFLKELYRSRAETEALRKQLAEFGAGEDTTTMTRKSFAEVLQALADAQKELAASRKWNQDLLDAARETRPDDDRRSAEWGLAVFADLKKTQKELAEANARTVEAWEARDEYLRTNVDLRDEIKRSRATLEATNARIAELGGLRPAVAEIERDEAIARTERAEEQRDAMRKALEFARSQVEGNAYGRTKTLAVIDAALTPPYSGWSGENAKLREALEQISDPHHDIEFAPSARELRAIARAALNPPPAGREG